MPIDFPNSPTNGTQTADGRYYFDSSVGSTGAWRSTPLPVGGLPAGSIMAWGTNTPPANWLLADGAAVSRSVYSSLFAVIGTTYGTGDGTSTFNLPDLRGRVPVGKNAGTFGTLGATGGAETHTLTEAQIPPHTHSWSAQSTGDVNDYIGGSVASFGISASYNSATNYGSFLSNTGGGQAHNNLQPYLVVNYIIKASAGWTAGDSELATRLGVVETANATTNKSGFVPVLPSSLVLGSGSATTSANGLITFTGANYVRLRGVFTSAYRHYHINISDVNTPAGNSYAYLQVNSNNTDNNAAYYTQSVFNQIGSSISAYNVNNGSAWDIGPTNAGNEYFSSSIDIFSPAVATYTKAVFRTTGGTGGVAAIQGGLLHANTNAFDGITLFNLNNTAFSGNIQVYGYR